MNVSRMARNASANIARVVVNILAALILPRLLLGTLSTDGYSVWVLIVQISLYSGYLNLGISTIVGRFVAFCNETGDAEGRNRIVSSGLAIMFALAGLAIAGLVIAAFSIGRLFPDIPAELLSEAAMTLLLVGSVIALRLPANIIAAVFIGMQRNEFPLAFTIAEKAFTILFVFIVAQMGGSLFQVGVAYSLALVATYVLEVVLFRRYAAEVHPAVAQVQWAAMRDIFQNTAALAIWSFSGLLISGVDLMVVGAFDFQAVAAFSFAVTLTTLITQVQSSAVTVVMPVAAALTGRQDEQRLASLLVRTTRYGVLSLYLVGLPLIASGALIISLWVGAEFVATTVPILIVLVIATIMRQSSLTFSMIVVGVGKQNKIIVSPLLGGLVNLVVSILATIQFGAIGAAFGTIIGGMVEVGMHIFYNLPRVSDLTIKPARYFQEGFVQPTLYALPGIVLAAAWLIWGAPAQHPVQSALFSLAIIMLVAGAGWFFGLAEEDRQRALGMIRRLLARFLPSNAASQ